MLRKLRFLTVLITLISTYSYAQVGTGSIRGKLTDSETGEPLPFVNIVVEADGRQVTGTSTDFDGKFTISPLDPGNYDIKVSFVGYKPRMEKGVRVQADKITPYDIKLTPSEIQLDEFEVVDYVVPLIDKDGGASGATITKDDIARMPGRSANAIASTVGGVFDDGSGQLNIRGARGDGNEYFIDGIRVRGSSALPQAAIEQVSVMTGGMPANYGDATGGIISVTTRGPAARYYGGIEYVTSGYKIGDQMVGLDNYGYNLLEGSISGPILFKKDSLGNKTDKPLLGFFLSGNYNNTVDDRPLVTGQWQIEPEARQGIVDAPLRPNPEGQGGFYNAEFLRQEGNFRNVATRQNAGSQSINLAGKLDVNVGETSNLTFGGQLVYNHRNLFIMDNSLMNSENNPINTNTTWRVYGKYTQRFPNLGGEDTNIKNAFYSIMVDYSRFTQVQQDERHRDRLFNYGYVGHFDIERQIEYEPQFDEQGFFTHYEQEAVPRDVRVTFTPDDVNSEMASLTTQFYELYDEPQGNYENLFQLQLGRGLRNGDPFRNIYGLWSAPGAPFNQYALAENNQFRVTGSGSAEINGHAITVGFEYEQRVDRGYTMGVRRGPVNLWEIMRQMTNSHLAELDRENPIIFNDGTHHYYRYNPIIGDQQFTFDRNLRESLGLDPRGMDRINIDALSPEDFSLDMFSADELLNNGQNFINYWGYDHTGQRTRGNPSLDDFFNERDDNGDFTRAIPAYQPIYMSGYVMDKFAFDDIIFNVGVRIDRFDANQPVLKDPFLLSEARTVAEVDNLGPHPDNMGNDYVVYVNDVNDPTAINGYRDGFRWFNSNGEEITNPAVISTAQGIAPYLVDPDADLSSNAFTDYTPQITVMPRIAFSFPISDEALFFAHYDVLAQRPGQSNRLNPIQYQYLEIQNAFINNPNLRPERTIDYALGFQQVLSKSSSLKIEAFYREQRDMIQAINMLEAYPRTYRSWDNIDFGTVKGLTVTYDLRRTRNVWMRVAYTLQFAEGTGSDAESGVNLINTGQPNLRIAYPYDFDQRHALLATIDYRYGSGKDYNGPVWFDKQVFANTGANLQANFGSGTPYSGQSNITPEVGDFSLNPSLEGSINGSRKPSQFRLDIQVDRDIPIKFGGKEEGKKARTANLNIYLLLNNALNNMNVLNVYRATGNPDNDGFLAAPEHQSTIRNNLDEQSFRDFYAMRVNNPFNFGLPRTIRLGIRFDF